jgi:hypothetical protein
VAALSISVTSEEALTAARATGIGGAQLWVPNRSSTSCDLGVFMDQSAEPVAALEAQGGR